MHVRTHMYSYVVKNLEAREEVKQMHVCVHMHEDTWAHIYKNTNTNMHVDIRFGIRGYGRKCMKYAFMLNVCKYTYTHMIHIRIHRHKHTYACRYLLPDSGVREDPTRSAG
jgi:hypothetical protein